MPEWGIGSGPLPGPPAPLSDDVAPVASPVPVPATPSGYVSFDTNAMENEADGSEPPFEPEVAAAPDRSPLGLILAIGGVLVFLAVVVYLNYKWPAVGAHFQHQP